MSEQVRDPYLKLALRMIKRAGCDLRRASNNSNAVARGLGFENTEHDILAFLASDTFDTLIDGITGLSPTFPGARTPLEYAQDILNTAYGGALTVVPSICPCEFVRRPGGRRPIGEGYVKLKPREGWCLLTDYELIILEGRSMPKYLVFDLREVRQALGEHYDATLEDSYPVTCPVCEAEVTQDLDECLICGTPVVWKSSTRWKLLYGSPAATVRRLSTVKPRDKAGIELCRLAGVTGFANKSEARRWARAAKKLGANRMLGIARHVAGNKRGRGVIAHALNLADKIVREEAIPKQKDRPTPSAEEKQVQF